MSVVERQAHNVGLNVPSAASRVSPCPVLFLSYHFPPSLEVGGRRPMLMAKYLPLYGYRPLVLTAQPQSLPAHLRRHMDWSQEISDETKVFRHPDGPHHYPDIVLPLQPTLWERLVGRARLLDVAGWWAVSAIGSMRRIIRDEGVRCVISTSPPHSLHLAAGLACRCEGIPWIADFRDPWLRPRAIGQGYLRGQAAQWIMGRADAVIANNSWAYDWMLREYSALSSERLSCVPNGYEVPCDVSAPKPRGGPLTFVHTGSLYHQLTLVPLIEAIALLKQKGATPCDLRLIQVGNVDPDHEPVLRRMIDKLGLAEFVQVHPPVSRSRCEQILAASDVAVLTVPDEFELAVPEKTYGYFAYQKPILVIGRRGATVDLIRATNSGIVGGHSPKELAAAVSQLLERHRRRDKLWEYSSRATKDYCYPQPARLLAQILDRLVVPSERVRTSE